MAPEGQAPAARDELEETFSLWNLPAVLAGAFSLYLIPYIGARWALPNHPIVAALVSLLSLAISILAAWWLAHSLKRKTPTVLIVALFVIAIVVSIGSFAGLSATIHTWRPSSYAMTATEPLLPVAGESRALITPEDPVGLFSHYYQLVLLDLIPGIDFTKTMAISPPVEVKSRLGGLPVLGFKIFVLVAVIGAFKKWRDLRKENRGESAARHP